MLPARDTPRWECDVEFDLDRMTQLLMATLMTLATVIVLGPGAPSILVQHAADRALAQLRRKR